MPNNATFKDPSNWPALTYEMRSWERTGDEIGSRRAKMRAKGDYRAAIPPFISSIEVKLDSDTQALADDASAELARFDAQSGNITAPFTSLLLRTESASSSEIENLTSSAKQLALAEIGAASSPNAKLIFANVQAMAAALELSDDISEVSIIAMHEALLADSTPTFVGKFRDQQVWIGGGSLSPHSAQFVPPHHNLVPDLMADLVKFSHRTDIPVLAHCAIAHAQFETIHPFPDGNGRTGRALIHSMLRHGGLTRNITVPVSAGLLGDTKSYFDALEAYRAGDISAIIAAVAEAAFEAISNGRQLINDLQSVAGRWQSEITSRRGSAPTSLKKLLIRQPVVTAKIVARELGVTEVSAQAAIDKLVGAGALEQTNNWKRNRIWHAPEVLSALDAFGERARRRR